MIELSEIDTLVT